METGPVQEKRIWVTDPADDSDEEDVDDILKKALEERSNSNNSQAPASSSKEEQKPIPIPEQFPFELDAGLSLMMSVYIKVYKESPGTFREFLRAQRFQPAIIEHLEQTGEFIMPLPTNHPSGKAALKGSIGDFQELLPFQSLLLGPSSNFETKALEQQMMTRIEALVQTGKAVYLDDLSQFEPTKDQEGIDKNKCKLKEMGFDEESADKLLAHPDFNIESEVFGIDLCSTNPDLLAKFLANPEGFLDLLISKEELKKALAEHLKKHLLT